MNVVYVAVTGAAHQVVNELAGALVIFVTRVIAPVAVNRHVVDSMHPFHLP